MNSLFDTIPGYRDAVARENLVRDASFLGLTETVAGIELKQMTAIHLLALDLAGSPFLSGGTLALPADVAIFLWALSTEYGPDRWFRRWRFIRQCRRLKFNDTCDAIQSYVDETFQDSPSRRSGVEEVSFNSYVADMVDILAREYKWSERDILSMPLKRAFQYLRCIRVAHNPKATMFNPSDSVKAEWLNTQNVTRN